MSVEQDEALARIGLWFRDPFAGQTFTLLGAAGTGKTTTAKRIPEVLGLPEERVEVAAYTGKAAHVLRSKGLTGARTLHNLLYKPIGDGSVVFNEETGQWEPIAKDAKKQPRFALNDESELSEAALLIVDEVSMVDAKMAADIFYFGKKVLVLGDKYQLPPVKGAGYFTTDRPDFELTQIHRQVAGSPIIDLATRVRRDEPIEAWSSGRSSAYLPLRLRDLGIDTQVIVGANKTRWSWNLELRDHFLSPPSMAPVKGDKLICLQNNKDLAVLNGQQFRVEGIESRTMRLRVDGATSYVEVPHVHVWDEDNGIRRTLPVWPQPLQKLKGAEEVKAFDYGVQQQMAMLTYGWAITCHKSQGSQWDSVLVVEDEWGRKSGHRWMYTAVTRAADRVKVIRPGQLIEGGRVKRRPARSAA